MSEEKSVGEKILLELWELEKKFWDRADYSEEDIPLFSNAMDFIEENSDKFIEYMNEREQAC